MGPCTHHWRWATLQVEQMQDFAQLHRHARSQIQISIVGWWVRASRNGGITAEVGARLCNGCAHTGITRAARAFAFAATRRTAGSAKPQTTIVPPLLAIRPPCI